jgi:hypothetical protein
MENGVHLRNRLKKYPRVIPATIEDFQWQVKRVGYTEKFWAVWQKEYSILEKEEPSGLKTGGFYTDNIFYIKQVIEKRQEEIRQFVYNF